MNTYLLKNLHGREVAIIKADNFTALERSDDGLWTHYVFFALGVDDLYADALQEIARIWAATDGIEKVKP